MTKPRKYAVFGGDDRLGDDGSIRWGGVSELAIEPVGFDLVEGRFMYTVGCKQVNSDLTKSVIDKEAKS